MKPATVIASDKINTYDPTSSNLAITASITKPSPSYFPRSAVNAILPGSSSTK